MVPNSPETKVDTQKSQYELQHILLLGPLNVAILQILTP